MIAGLFKLIVSALAAVGGIFIFDIEGWSLLWFTPLAFICGFILANIALWVFFIAVALTAGKKSEGGKLSRFYGSVLNCALTEACGLARIKVKTTGNEKLPCSPYLLVANHRSNFDNFILSSVIRNPYLIFISKPENFKIPIAGRFILRCGYLAIDRQNPRNALKAIHKAADMIKTDGASVGVFPEGTRGHIEGQLGDFSEGCFLIAKKAHCPVVVAVIKGSGKIHKRFPLTTEVELDFIDTFSVEDVEQKRSGELSELAHSLICANL